MAQGSRLYGQMCTSLSTGMQEEHTCTRMCEFKQVFGNMWYCCTSGQAHVCDQNCAQRIYYDNHHDICRLSKRIFPRTQQAMADAARKRGGEEVAGEAPLANKRQQSADWEAQAAAVAAAQQQQQQQWQVHPAQLQPQAAPQGWAC